MIHTLFRGYFLRTEIDYLRGYGMIKDKAGTVPYIPERHASRKVRTEVFLGYRMPPIGFPGTFILPPLFAGALCVSSMLIAPIIYDVPYPVVVCSLLAVLAAFFFWLGVTFVSWSQPFIRATHENSRAVYTALLEQRIKELDALK